MTKSIILATATALALAGCGTSEVGPRADLPRNFADGNCFRASDVTNYNVKDENAVFVLTSRGYVYGLIGPNCYKNNGDRVMLPRSRRGETWICAGDRAAVEVSRWRTTPTQCLAHVTAPIFDADVSGFRSRAQPAG